MTEDISIVDLSLLIPLLLTLIIAGGIGWFFIHRFVTNTKNEFRDHQPALRITNLAIMNTGDLITLTPELENIGPGVAYECILQLAGWDGSFSVKTLYPHGPRYQRHSVPIVLGPDAPIRTKSMSRCFLRVAYRDRWEQRYECWYPVEQTRSTNTRLYDIRIDLSQHEFTEPHPSVREMRRLLRQTAHDEYEEEDD